MWVMTDYGIGILFDISKGIVHLVGQDGQTTEAVVVNLNGIRQAKWKEIPECRRQITEEEGKALGYGS